MSTAIEKYVSSILADHIGVTAPGFCVQAYVKSKKRIDVSVGDTFKYYDWASITKIVSTVSLVAKAIEDKKIHLNTAVPNILKWSDLPANVGQLLSHKSGLPWWKPFYKEISSEPFFEVKYKLKNLLRDLKLEQSDKCVYSDPDFLYLGEILEEIYESSFFVLWNQLSDRLEFESAHYCVGNQPKYKRHLYAPTERCPWRKKVLQGEVHDENTWALGGVAPHSGLFGTISDLSRYGLELRRAMYGEKSKLPKTLKQLTQRAVPVGVGDWAYGFMMPSAGASSTGQYFDLNSVGHLGFTGTSLWFDPKHDLLVCILSNRVHPTRENENIKKFRPLIHDQIFEQLKGAHYV